MGRGSVRNAGTLGPRVECGDREGYEQPWSDAPGVRHHVKPALALGALVEEIMDVLKLCVAQGVQACNMGVPILEEELEKRNRV